MREERTIRAEKTGFILVLIIIYIMMCLLSVIFLNERAAIRKDASREHDQQKSIEKSKKKLSLVKEMQIGQTNPEATLLVLEEDYIYCQIISGKYIFTETSKHEYTEENRTYINNLKVQLYDFGTFTLKKEIEIQPLIENAIGEPIRIVSSVYFDRSHEDKLSLYVDFYEEDKKVEMSAYFSDEFELLRIEKKQERSRKILGPEIQHLSAFKNYDFKQAQEFDENLVIDISDNRQLRLNFRGTSLPQENQTLYELFPILASYIGDYDTILMIQFDEPLTPEALLGFLKEDHMPFFKEYVMHSYEAIDEKEHNINSISDYFKWSNSVK